MNKQPIVSVVMSVYNGERFLSKAIESVIQGTFQDYEFIIINDGSTDRTGEILESFRKKDSRIQIYNQENRGLIASLNRGCKMAQGKYIARMDADDISSPARIEKELIFLENHPDVGVVSVWMECIDETGSLMGRIWELPELPGMIVWNLYFSTCIVHAAALLRREVFERAGGYRPEALYIEDYDLWIRIAKISKLANLKEVLYQRRDWKDSVCSLYGKEQEEQILKIAMPEVENLIGSEMSIEEFKNLRRVHQRKGIEDPERIRQTTHLLDRMYRVYVKKRSLSRDERKAVDFDVARKLCTLARSASRYSSIESAKLILKAIRVSPVRLPLRILQSGFKKGVS